MTIENPWQPGRNCWRVESAHRASFLVDGESYFQAVRSAIIQARESIHILAWDIHSQVRLLREESDDGWPITLMELLNAVVHRNPKLRAYVLAWDFAMIYAMEREWLPTLRFRWNCHRRVRIHLDAEHPLGASHHQKIVVVDDRVAFCGGMDLSIWRWDTSAHDPKDSRRVDPYGKTYQPFHDVQMVVDGNAARALGELARSRWHSATGEKLRQPRGKKHSDPWPKGIDTNLHQPSVAIARTAPPFRGGLEVREVEALYLDLIRKAQNFIYIENQFLSSRTIAEALARRLSEPNGPEVVMILPLQTGGWLEQHTMDLLRNGLLETLREADQHNRFRVYYPVAGNGTNQPVYVHSKVMIVDDRVVRVGSSNLSNRSMVMDTECDLAVAAGTSEQYRRAIAHFRTRLLAEHLRMTFDSVQGSLSSRTSLIASIEKLRGAESAIRPLQVRLNSEWERQLAESKWLDPEQPVDPECYINDLVADEERSSLRRRTWIMAVVTGLLLLMAVLWRWGPLHDLLGQASFEELFQAIDRNPLSSLAAILLTFLLGSVGVPITFVLVAAALAFGPWTGFLYVVCGALASALTLFGLGNKLGTDLARRIAGKRWSRLRRLLERRGILIVILIRLLPVAPFAVVNLAAGASNISWRQFTIGSLIGMIPGMLIISLVADRTKSAMQDPSVINIVLLVGVVVLAAVGVMGVHRWVRRSMKKRSG